MPFFNLIADIKSKESDRQEVVTPADFLVSFFSVTFLKTLFLSTLCCDNSEFRIFTDALILFMQND